MTKTQNPKTTTLILALMAILCAIIAIQTFAEDNVTQSKPATAAWQHLALTHNAFDAPKTELARSINKLGREGWELVSVENFTKSGTTSKTVFYFKKPL